MDFLKRKKNQPVDDTPKSSAGLVDRWKQGLARTRQVFGAQLLTLLKGSHSQIDQTLLENLEDFLLESDIGFALSETLIKDLKKNFEGQTAEAIRVQDFLKQKLLAQLLPYEKPLIETDPFKPFLILVVGVNGAGKTTTIAKLAHFYKNQEKRVLLAAGDTFRAAAVEQLVHWGDHNAVPVIAGQRGADSAAVIFDAFQAARAREFEVLIADTAGRLHTQAHLMEELKKVKRVLAQCDPHAPHEILLVLDATIGQNALIQAQKFHEAIQFTGIALTKLDGTAKGGILFNIAQSLKTPIRFIGMGESVSDLKVFKSKDFVDALFD